MIEDQNQIRDLIRRVTAEKVAPRAHEIDATAEYPNDIFELLKELGLFTLPFPKEFGGMDSMESACLAIEEFGRVCFNTAYVLSAQWGTFGALLAGGTADQKKRYLHKLASGEYRAAIALTETQSGSDIAGIRTRAVRDGDGYRITGSKIWCTNADVADFFMVAAKTGDSNDRRSIYLFIVDRGTPGFEIGRKESKVGARGLAACPLYFDKAYVPEGNRIGEEGAGFKVVMEELNRARPIIGARAVGLAQGAMDLTIDFIKNRVAFGHPVSDYQGIRWEIANMAIQIEAARNLVYRAAKAVDEGMSGKELAQLAAISKCHATDTAMQVATDAMQIFGAAGISMENPINRYFRDAKVLQIVEGTNHIQRNIIAGNLLGKPSSS